MMKTIQKCRHCGHELYLEEEYYGKFWKHYNDDNAAYDCFCGCTNAEPIPNFKDLSDANFDLVDFSKITPCCKKHGAMNKLTNTGIWRCVSTYAEYWVKGDRKFRENNCMAGCQEVNINDIFE